jgi:carboxyl-terminal processing protease
MEKIKSPFTGKKVLTIYLLVLGFILAVGGGYFWGRFGVTDLDRIYSTVSQSRIKPADLPGVLKGDLLKLIWSNLQEGYLRQDKIDPAKMYYGALGGFVAGLDDPYTVYFDPAAAREFTDDINGQFGGIGAELGLKNDRLTIIAPIPDTPAAAAGLQAGDVIYAIDKRDATGLTVEQAVKLIRGEPGTSVVLLLVRGAGEPQEVTITRAIISIKSVKWNRRADGLMYVELASFGSDTSDLFDKLIVEIKKNKPKGLILDLRNDPGGLLSTANYITSKWLKPGSTVVIEKFADDHRVTHTASGGSELLGMPTVVLINAGSASASEILSGALKDYGVATLVGEKSFGKGSVQEVRDLPDGSALKMTVAEWLTPKGNSINELGIEPDVVVARTYEQFTKNQDPQLDKAVEILLKK